MKGSVDDAKLSQTKQDEEYSHEGSQDSASRTGKADLPKERASTDRNPSSSQEQEQAGARGHRHGSGCTAAMLILQGALSPYLARQ